MDLNPVIKSYLSYLHLNDIKKYEQTLFTVLNVSEEFTLQLIDNDIYNSDYLSRILRRCVLCDEFFDRYGKYLIYYHKNYDNIVHELIYNKTLTAHILNNIFPYLDRDFQNRLKKLVIENYYNNLDQEKIDLLLTFQ